MINTHPPKLVFTACIALALALTSPVMAIQNIGFPDDQGGSRLAILKSDLTQFQLAQKTMHEALLTLIKYDGVDGESKKRDAALKSIDTNSFACSTRMQAVLRLFRILRNARAIVTSKLSCRP